MKGRTTVALVVLGFAAGAGFLAAVLFFAPRLPFRVAVLPAAVEPTSTVKAVIIIPSPSPTPTTKQTATPTLAPTWTVPPIPTRIATRTPTRTPTPTVVVTTHPYVRQARALWDRFVDYAEARQAWIRSANAGIIDGYATEGYWNIFCGPDGWFWDLLWGIKNDVLELSPPSSYQRFHDLFAQLIDLHIELDGIHEQLCQGDPSEGLMLNEQLREQYNDLLARADDLDDQVYGLLP